MRPRFLLFSAIRQLERDPWTNEIVRRSMFVVTVEIVFGGSEKIAVGRGRTLGKKMTELLIFMHRRTCRITRL